MDAITVRHIGKNFESGTRALSDVSFTIAQGEVFGFLGPNGSGKTTMVRLLNGILAPSEGTAEILGCDVATGAADIHRLCGVLTETAAPYERMTARENLLFFGQLHDLPDAETRRRADALLETMSLSAHADKKVKAFSTGMKKRLLLARALLHQPKVLFLDEPTNGLDPEAAADVTALLSELSARDGITIFLCTHQLKYAQDICTRYGFLQQGTLLATGTFDELLARQGGKTRLVVRGSGLPCPPGAERLPDGGVTVTVHSDDEAAMVLTAMLAAGGRIYEARQERWSLEELYFSFRKPEPEAVAGSNPTGATGRRALDTAPAHPADTAHAHPANTAHPTAAGSVANGNVDGMTTAGGEKA